MVRDAGIRQKTVGDSVILVLCMVIIPLTHLGLSFPFRPSMSNLDFITFPEQQDLDLGLHNSAAWLMAASMVYPMAWAVCMKCQNRGVASCYHSACGIISGS